MAISKESKQEIKRGIETLSVQKKIAERKLARAERDVASLTSLVSEINSTLAKLEADSV